MTKTKKFGEEESKFPISFKVEITAEYHDDLGYMISFLEETMDRDSVFNRWRRDLLNIFKEKR